MASVIISTVIGVAYTVVVAFVFFMLGLGANRPNLIQSGSGGSRQRIQDKDVWITSVSIYNDPDFLGVKINRESAIITSAMLYDHLLSEHVPCSLVWSASAPHEHQITIETGKTKTLYLFGKEITSEEYFIYNPTIHNPDRIHDLVTFKDARRDFSLVLRDHIGREYRFDFTARNSKQKISTMWRLTWRSRWESLLEAFGALRSAFRLR
jgi:hypothetical protein